MAPAPYERRPDMRFIAKWMEERSGYIDATDAKAAEGVIRHRLSIMPHPDRFRLLSIEREAPPAPVTPLTPGAA